jgi:membrane-associated phospholipid phosphatase
MGLARISMPLLDELMHAFYLSYYPLIVGGIVIAWVGPSRQTRRPDPSFHTVMTAMMLGFVFAYVWYPFLPARGPWENRDLMQGLPEFDGALFTPLARGLIDQMGVSGACFPSAHVSGTAGLIVGLTAAHRRSAAWFALVALGLCVACVYTRYHHAVDVLAGLVVGVAGGALGLILTSVPAPRTE